MLLASPAPTAILCSFCVLGKALETNTRAHLRYGDQRAKREWQIKEP